MKSHAPPVFSGEHVRGEGIHGSCLMTMRLAGGRHLQCNGCIPSALLTFLFADENIKGTNEAGIDQVSMDIAVITKTEALLARTRATRERAASQRAEWQKRAEAKAARPAYVLKNRQWTLPLSS